MTNSDAEKKHPASPTKRKRAREAGQVARSHDLSSSLVLLLGLVLLWWSGPRILAALASVMHSSLSERAYLNLDSQTATQLLASAAWRCGEALWPMMVGVCGVALLNNWIQAGRILAPQALSLQWERISPAQGLQRLTSPPNLARLGFGLIKVLAIVLIVVCGLWGRWQGLLTTHDLSLPQLMQVAWNTLFTICLEIAVALLLLAVADYGFQWWQLERSLRMTDEELREENKANQGHPQLTSQRKRRRGAQR